MIDQEQLTGALTPRPSLWQVIRDADRLLSQLTTVLTREFVLTSATPEAVEMIRRVAVTVEEAQDELAAVASLPGLPAAGSTAARQSSAVPTFPGVQREAEKLIPLDFMGLKEKVRALNEAGTPQRGAPCQCAMCKPRGGE